MNVDMHDHYKIVEAEYAQSLQYQVNEMIRDGWLPLGGPMIKNHYWVQAIWKPPLPEGIMISMDKVENSDPVK